MDAEVLRFIANLGLGGGLAAFISWQVFRYLGKRDEARTNESDTCGRCGDPRDELHRDRVDHALLEIASWAKAQPEAQRVMQDLLRECRDWHRENGQALSRIEGQIARFRPNGVYPAS